MTKKAISKIGAALVTGAAKRIGAKMVQHLAKIGYDIVIGYNTSKQEAEDLAAEIKKEYQVNCEIFSANLIDLNQAQKLADFTRKTFPHWNLLINNASIFNKSQFLTAPQSEMIDNMNLHVNSPLILAKEFARNCEEQKNKNSQIINIIDKNIGRSSTSYFYYLLSKKSLADATKMLSMQLAPNIRVNGIAPGFVLNTVLEIDHEKELQKYISINPLKSKCEIENITQTIDFLLQNNFVTGQIIFTDGGASLSN